MVKDLSNESQLFLKKYFALHPNCVGAILFTYTKVCMVKFDEEELDKLSYLCRIECSQEEKAALCKHLSNVLEYIKQLEEVNTEGASPCFTVLDTLTNAMRDDEVGGLLARDLFLANAPSHVGGMIRTPPILKHLTS